MTTDIKTLRDRLDRQFAKFIRRRDTDFKGKGICCTCAKKVNYQSGTCGHFISRQKTATRWDERNCNLQCKKCNAHGDGRRQGHAIFIDETYGVGTSGRLWSISGKRFYLNEDWLTDKIKYYKLEIKKLPKHFEDIKQINPTHVNHIYIFIR